jgi:hypothetical protein
MYIFIFTSFIDAFFYLFSSLLYKCYSTVIYLGWDANYFVLCSVY